MPITEQPMPKPTATKEELIAAVAAIKTNGRWEHRDYDDAIRDDPAFRSLGYSERWEIIRAAMLKKKQDAMLAREVTKKGNAAKPKSTKKLAGKFQSRRLKNFPDYVIDQNGHVVGLSGELKYRWNAGKPYVRLAGKDRSVYWLLVEVGFEEHPNDKKARRAKAKPDPYAGYNDEAEAIAEDPESYGCDENGDPVG